MSPNLAASVLMILAFMVFTLMSVLVRSVGDRVPVVQVVLVRQLVAFALLAPWFWRERAQIRRPTGLKLHLARGVASDHYRLGWEEMQEKGAPVVEGIVDLPDRLPGPGTDNLATPGGFALEGTGDFAPAFKLPGGKP